MPVKDIVDAIQIPVADLEHGAQLLVEKDRKRVFAEFVESDEPAAAFAARAGSVVRALLAAQADKGKGAGEFLG